MRFLGVEIEVRGNVALSQAYGCRFFLHVGSVAIFIGGPWRGWPVRLELCTPYHWFRFSRGGADK